MNVIGKTSISPDVQSQSGAMNTMIGVVTTDEVFADLLTAANSKAEGGSTEPPEIASDQAEHADKDAIDLWPVLLAAGMPQSLALNEPDAVPEIANKPGASLPGAAPASDAEELAANFVEPSVTIEIADIATYRSPKPTAVKSCDGSQSSFQVRFEASVTGEGIKAGEISDTGVLPMANVALDRTTTHLDGANGTNGLLAEGIVSQATSAVKETMPTAQSAGVSTTGAKGEDAWPITHLRVLDLVLKPQHLGHIEVKMKLSDGGLTMMLTPQSEQTRLLLERQLDGLKDGLVGSGYELAEISLKSATGSVATKDAASHGTMSSDGGREGAAFGEPRGGQRGHEQNNQSHHGHHALPKEQQADKDMRFRSGLYV